MKMASNSFSFNHIKKALSKLNPETNAAEAHGMLCGFIASGNKMNGKSWLEAILGHKAPEYPKKKQFRDLVLHLYQDSFEKLQSLNFDFQLLLPNDNQSLAVRAQALSNWCQGFLMGLKLAGIDIYEGVSLESQEALRHLIEISSFDYTTIEISEEDELAFFEVSEYVRMSIILIHTEIMIMQTENSSFAGH